MIVDIEQEFKEREELELLAIPLIFAAVLGIDKSLIKSRFVDQEAFDDARGKLFDARRLGWGFLERNAIDENVKLAIVSADDSSLWAYQATSRIVETSQDIIDKSIDGADQIESKKIAENVLKDRRKDRAEYYAIDAVNGSVEIGKAAAIAAIAAPKIVKKTWRNAGDNRVRKTHVAAQGQTVYFYDSFTVGGFRLKYPKDPAAPLSETANCRCGVEYSVSWSKK